jgi:hypothetical protein
MERIRQPRIILSLYCGILVVGVLPALLEIFGTRSQTRDAVLLGYSLERLFLGSILFLIALGLLYLAIWFVRYPEKSGGVWGRIAGDRALYNKILWGNAILLLVCWLAIFFPSYRITGNLSEYITQLRPVLVWLAVVAVVTFLLLLLARGKESLGEIVIANKAALRMGGIMLALILLIWGVVAFTGIGVLHREDYWYGPGVPVLGLQVLFSVLLGAAVLWVESRRSITNGRRLDAWICLAIWGIAAFLWAGEPLRPNYFMPDTGNNFIYPYSDSATFDIPSQYALIGQGLFNGQYFDRALYSAYLTYLHVFAGQETERLMVVQAVLFAVFPVLIYLIGRELHSRALGVSAAVLVLLRGVNAIAAATWLDLAGPKMMLTDFPTAIGIAIFVLFILKWLNDPASIRFAVCAGGALGMTVMLRTHVVLLAPIILAFILLPTLRLRWNHRGFAALALILGMLAATTPWDVRNLSNGTPMFYVYYFRIQVILRERYGIQDDARIPSPPVLLADRNTRQRTVGGGGFIENNANPFPMALDNCDSQACSIVNHFFRNLVTSALFMPSTLAFDSLWNTVKEGEPYWSQHWQGGGIGSGAGVLLAVNLALVSLGIGAAWERRRIIGLLPLLVLFAYLATNALGFTSGGRYIVPVDWIVCVYFLLGILQIAFWLLRRVEALPHGLFQNIVKNTAPPMPLFSGTPVALVGVLLFGALVPFSEMPFPQRYQVRSPQEILAVLDERGLLEQGDLDRAALSAFLSDPRAVAIEGRALYPRYYLAGDGERKRNYPYLQLEYPRQAFLTIGPYGASPENVVVSGGRIRADLHAYDVVVIGCREDQFLDALVVFVLSEWGHVHFRSPLTDWTCPLPEPVEPA